MSMARQTTTKSRNSHSKKLIYKYRSMNSLLKNKELEENYIHLSAFRNFNDPLDGYVELEFIGDKILWTNFIKNYVYAYFALYLNFEICKFYNVKTIPVRWLDYFLLSQKFAHDYVRECDDLNNACCNFIENQLSDIVNTIPLDKAIYLDNLSKYLEKLHDRILNVEHANYTKHIESISLNKYYKRFDVPLFSDSFELDNSLILKEEIYESSMYEYLLISFPKQYLKNLNKFMFNFPYVASFTKKLNSLPMWGYYADSSKGVCLIFKTENRNGKDYFPLLKNKEYKGIEKIPINKVNYAKTLYKVPFFNNLGRLSAEELKKYWYELNGKISPTGIKIFNNVELYRRMHWDTKQKILNSKLKLWKHEEEYRINMNCPTPPARLYFKIESLQGIVFGINTIASHKNKVIEILKRKMKENKELNLCLYDTIYVNSTNKIKKKKIAIFKNSEFRFIT